MLLQLEPVEAVEDADEPEPHGGYVYWLWVTGEYSTLHRKHPKYYGVTWCGAIHKARRAGVERVYRTVHDPNKIGRTSCLTFMGVTGCLECILMPNPVFLVGFETPEARAEAKQILIARRKANAEKRAKDAARIDN